MAQIENWERWDEEERRSDIVYKAWTHRILRNLYRDAEEEFSVTITDMWEDDDEYGRWVVSIHSPTIDSAGSFRREHFENRDDAEDFAVRWLKNHPLEDQLGWMSLAGFGSPEDVDDEEFEESMEMLEDKKERFEDKGIESRIRYDEDVGAYKFEVDTEDFIDAGMRLG